MSESSVIEELVDQIKKSRKKEDLDLVEAQDQKLNIQLLVLKHQFLNQNHPRKGYLEDC